MIAFDTDYDTWTGTDFPITAAYGASARYDAAALHRSDERFHLLAEAMPQFVWVSDVEGVVVYVNSRWTHYTGLTLEQTRAEASNFIHPEDACVMKRQWDEARAAGTGYEAEFRCKRLSDGVYRWFLARCVPLKHADGQIAHWVGTATDIEAQKQAEAHVHLLNTRLHRALYEASHRIKNQLQFLTTTIDLALMDGDELIPADKFQKLGSQIHTLSILQDVLTFEWRTGTTGEATMLDIKTMLEEVLGILQHASSRHRLICQIAEAKFPMHIATSLALIANEVVSNAIKHGKSDVHVTFDVDGADCVLEVYDNGPGFPVGFDPAKAANTGLELISALTVQDLQGAVRYENRGQGGGRVLVAFPWPR